MGHRWHTILTIAQYLLPDLESRTRAAPLLERRAADGELAERSAGDFTTASLTETGSKLSGLGHSFTSQLLQVAGQFQGLV